MHIHVYAHMCEYLPRSFVCMHGRGYRLHTGVYQAYATEVFMYFLALLLKSCAPDTAGRQGGDYVVAGCTGGCRYDSLLCYRCGIVDLFKPANTALLCGCYFYTSYPVSCMYVRDFYWDFIEHMLLYMHICILTVLAKFYDMWNPEILCRCLFYLLFTCTLSEMINKRCPTFVKCYTRGYIQRQWSSVKSYVMLNL